MQYLKIIGLLVSVLYLFLAEKAFSSDSSYFVETQVLEAKAEMFLQLLRQCNDTMERVPEGAESRDECVNFATMMHVEWKPMNEEIQSLASFTLGLANDGQLSNYDREQTVALYREIVVHMRAIQDELRRAISLRQSSNDE